jgi:hypothetical protein
VPGSFSELIGIPGEKLLHEVFLVSQRTRLVATGANAAVSTFCQALILCIGLGPNMSQIFQILVNTFHRVGCNEPLGPHKSFVDRKWEDSEGDDVVT